MLWVSQHLPCAQRRRGARADLCTVGAVALAEDHHLQVHAAGVSSRSQTHHVCKAECGRRSSPCDSQSLASPAPGLPASPWRGRTLRGGFQWLQVGLTAINQYVGARIVIVVSVCNATGHRPGPRHVQARCIASLPGGTSDSPPAQPVRSVAHHDAAHRDRLATVRAPIAFHCGLQLRHPTQHTSHNNVNGTAQPAEQLAMHGGAKDVPATMHWIAATRSRHAAGVHAASAGNEGGHGPAVSRRPSVGVAPPRVQPTAGRSAARPPAAAGRAVRSTPGSACVHRASDRRSQLSAFRCGRCPHLISVPTSAPAGQQGLRPQHRPRRPSADVRKGLTVPQAAQARSLPTALTRCLRATAPALRA